MLCEGILRAREADRAESDTRECTTDPRKQDRNGRDKHAESENGGGTRSAVQVSEHVALQQVRERRRGNLDTAEVDPVVA